MEESSRKPFDTNTSEMIMKPNFELYLFLSCHWRLDCDLYLFEFGSHMFFTPENRARGEEGGVMRGNGEDMTSIFTTQFICNLQYIQFITRIKYVFNATYIQFLLKTSSYSSTSMPKITINTSSLLYKIIPRLLSNLRLQIPKSRKDCS